jgi:hypothetical protein
MNANGNQHCVLEGHVRIQLVVTSVSVLKVTFCPLMADHVEVSIFSQWCIHIYFVVAKIIT